MTVYPDSNRLDLSDLSLPLLYLFLSSDSSCYFLILPVITRLYPVSTDYTRYQQIIPVINRLYPVSPDYTRYHLTIFDILTSSDSSFDFSVFLPEFQRSISSNNSLIFNLFLPFLLVFAGFY